MTELGVRCRTVPVLNTCRNVNAITGLHLHSIFATFLIVSTTCYTYQNLPTAFGSMVDMPVVAAAGLEGYIVDANLLG